jgi:spore germination protein
VLTSRGQVICGGGIKVNKENPRFQITNFQLASIVVCNIIGLGILTMPRLIAKDAAQDGWITTLIVGFIMLVAVYLMNLVCRRFPNLTLVEILDVVFGKYIGKVFALIFICFNIVLAALMVRLWAGIISAYLLPRTPTSVIIAVLLLAVSYLTVEGLKNIGRICEISQFLVAPLFVVIIITIPEADWLNLMPVGGAGIQNILKASATTGLSYCGLIVFMVIYPFNIKKEWALLSGITGVLFVIFTYLFLVVVTTAVFGSVGIQGIRWPLLELMSIATFPVIERLDFVVLVFYQLIVYRITTLSIFMAGFNMAKIFNLKEHRYMVLAILPAVYTIAILPKDAFEVAKLSDWTGIAGILIDFFYPAILLLGATLWVKKEKSNA